jgi:ubiquinone/menaquinone biosynthesis C-methylase UbiE
MTLPDLKQLESDWEVNARVDPAAAIANWPGKHVGESGQWTPEEFFALGEREFRHFLTHWGYQPKGVERALDIGCGMGRLTRAMSHIFGEVHGVDIAPTMVDLARQHNRCYANVFFHCGPGHSFPMFPDGCMDVVFSYIVFQHMPEEAVFSCLRDISRILVPKHGQAFLHFALLAEPGGADTPPQRPARFASTRAGLYRVLRALGSEKWALRVWNPVITNCISHQRLTDFAKSVGLTCLRSVLIPSLITEGRSHAESTFLLFQKPGEY